MVKKVIWAKEASLERNNILAYWNWHNKSNEYSKKLLILFKGAINSIKSSPQVGKPTSRPDTKLRIVRDYFIVYRIKEDTIRILSVWDTRQNPSKLDEIIKNR